MAEEKSRESVAQVFSNIIRMVIFDAHIPHIDLDKTLEKKWLQKL